jgi:ABC-type transporter Mla subunit MlaD
MTARPYPPYQPIEGLPAGLPADDSPLRQIDQEAHDALGNAATQLAAAHAELGKVMTQLACARAEIRDLQKELADVQRKHVETLSRLCTRLAFDYHVTPRTKPQAKDPTQ